MRRFLIGALSAAALVAAVFVAEALGASARAALNPVCLTERDAQRAVGSDNPSARVALRLSGARARAFLRVFNAIPPPTHLVGDVLVFYAKPTARRYLVQVFDRRCLSAVITIAPHILRRLWPDVWLDLVSKRVRNREI